MRRLAPVVFIFAAVWLWDKFHHRSDTTTEVTPAETPLLSQVGPTENEAFRCDGRQYCSQMHSCAEATYFLRNCPNVKMDGNHDGVPCEQQWCGSR